MIILLFRPTRLLAIVLHLSIEAWSNATQGVFPESVSNREIGCPKSVFLGLAEEGLLKYIPTKNYTRSKDNKRYALDAI
ncbi:hypothetical protein TW85_21810 [Marinomonas sp. S3726]|nr:hypothetical protein TW85_21810 [Marinomonas sp. S3726]